MGNYSGNHPRFSKRQEEHYDAKMAHDKDLTASARLHYLENDETHHPAKNYDTDKGSHAHPHPAMMSEDLSNPVLSDDMNLTGNSYVGDKDGSLGFDVPNKKLDYPVKKHGFMKGDQSATHIDYANYKGTDKGYHGHGGSSHGDQSATHRDYMKGNVSHPAKEHGKNHGVAPKLGGRPSMLRHCGPGHK